MRYRDRGSRPQRRGASTVRIQAYGLDDRLDLIKLLQGVANSEVAGERYIVIGADPRERKFYPVSNAAEFDPARVNSVLTKYLDPLPAYELFNNLVSNNQSPIVVFILAPTQPRPIVVKTEGKKPDGKIRLQIGEIWVKKGTALQLATRTDIDAMYRQRMEEEAEHRARKRFKHFTEVSGPPPVHLSSPTRMPVRELLLGLGATCGLPTILRRTYGGHRQCTLLNARRVDT